MDNTFTGHQKDTLEFIDLRMQGVSCFRDRFELLDHAIQTVSVGGLWLEFGVYKGTTINHISSKTNLTIYGFDSFEGLPEDWIGTYKEGKFRLETMPAVNPNVQLVTGKFSNSLPFFLSIHKKPAAFVHIDCDLYSSTKTIFDLMGDRFFAGSVIVFDEFFNYPGWQDHEYKAFMGFVESRKVKFEYIGYVDQGSQVAVRIR